jgi:DMSO/TMAO reductase YedYZ molybdopterin-dependent catalytic subunit
MFGRIWIYAVFTAAAAGLQLLDPIGLAAQSPPAPAQTTSGYSSSFRIDGAVVRPSNFTLRDLRAMPPTNENVYYNTGKGPVAAEFTGVLLWDLLNKVGVKTNAAIKNDILRRSVVVTATDGYIVYLSAGELAPSFGGHQALIAYAQDGEMLGQDSGFARLVMPADKAGGRYVSWIKSIQIY